MYLYSHVLVKEIDRGELIMFFVEVVEVGVSKIHHHEVDSLLSR